MHVQASMTTKASISPTIAYYIRKLLRQNIDQLRSVVAPGAGMSADPLSNFDTVLESLYLEPSKIQATIQELETRALTHQSLSAQGTRYRKELKQQEEKIFWLLGFKYQKPVRQGKILLIDDTADNLNLLSRAMTREGYEVQTARSGREGLSTLMTFTPDLILLDILMPGMGGFEICAQLKKNQRYSPIPVIFISSMNETAEKVKAFEVGGADYVTKPFHLDEVLVRVAHQVDLTHTRKRIEAQNIRLQSEIQERQQAEEQYRSIFENAIDGMFQSTPEGRYIRVNKALTLLYGYPSAEALLDNLTNIQQQLYVDTQRRTEFQQRIETEQRVSNFESEIYRRDGTTLWISEDVRQVKDIRGITLYYEGIVRPIPPKSVAAIP